MTLDANNRTSVHGAGHEATPYDAEHTLRLVAQLAPPEQLEGRVHRRLAAAAQAAPAPRSFWSLWTPGRRLQFAGAALLVAAVAGSSWTVYRGHPQGGQAGTAGASTRPVSQAPPPPQLPLSQKSGGFSTAGAEARPGTLTPIRVPAKNAVAAKKKPSASRLPKPKAASAEDNDH